MTNTLNPNQYYRTTSLSLAAAISLSFPMEAVDRQNPTKAQFLFLRDENLDRLVESYWRGELKVSPQAYFEQLKAIKARLYGEE